MHVGVCDLQNFFGLCGCQDLHACGGEVQRRLQGHWLAAGSGGPGPKGLALKLGSGRDPTVIISLRVCFMKRKFPTIAGARPPFDSMSRKEIHKIFDLRVSKSTSQSKGMAFPLPPFKSPRVSFSGFPYATVPAVVYSSQATLYLAQTLVTISDYVCCCRP